MLERLSVSAILPGAGDHPPLQLPPFPRPHSPPPPQTELTPPHLQQRIKLCCLQPCHLAPRRRPARLALLGNRRRPFARLLCGAGCGPLLGGGIREAEGTQALHSLQRGPPGGCQLLIVEATGECARGGVGVGVVGVRLPKGGGR